MQQIKIALAPARGGEPSHVMKPNSATKTLSATQFTFLHNGP
jgi:hypothetical protein